MAENLSKMIILKKLSSKGFYESIYSTKTHISRTEIGKASLSLTDLERYQNSTYEDLVQDLSAAIKAKVDLLKDLTRAGKESVFP